MSRELGAAGDWPFYAILAHLYRQADTLNQGKIRALWPGFEASFCARRDAPAGVLPEVDGYTAETFVMANGTDGDSYEARYCAYCLHYSQAEGECCPVLMLHLLWNYEQHNADDPVSLLKHQALEQFIPTDDAQNQPCRMWAPIHDGVTEPGGPVALPSAMQCLPSAGAVEAYEQGKLSYKCGAPLSHNPYHPQASHRPLWVQGWQDAQAEGPEVYEIKPATGEAPPILQVGEGERISLADALETLKRVAANLPK